MSGGCGQEELARLGSGGLSPAHAQIAVVCMARWHEQACVIMGRHP